MKKLIVFTLVVMALVTICGYRYIDRTNEYTLEGEVIDTNEANGLVIVLTLDGNEWAYYGDGNIGDMVILSMHSNGTDTLYDDMILAVNPMK